MRSMLKSLALVLSFALSVGFAMKAFAAPPSKAAAEVKPVTVAGVVEKLIDGSVILKLELSDEKRAAVLRASFIQSGLPTSPGRIGALKGDVYARYSIGNRDAVTTLEKSIGKRVEVVLDRGLKVQGFVDGR